MSRRPAALLFDANGTIFPASAAASALRDLGLPSSAVELWFARVLRDGFAAQLAGAPVTFRQLAGLHLDSLLAAHPASPHKQRLAGEQALQSVLAAWAAADVYPDAPLAFRALHSAGLRLAVLTNGSADAIVRPVLQKAGVEGLFSALLDVGMTGAWKPSPGSYAFAERHLGLPAEQARRRAALIMLVASHPWDTFGALQAGLQAAYVQRDAAEPYPAFLPRQPQLVVRTFEELAAALTGA